MAGYKDPHSFSNPHEVVIRDSKLEMEVNFFTRAIEGKVTHTIENLSGSTCLKLDIKDLTIYCITLDDDQETAFGIGPRNKYLGNRLAIEIKVYTRQVNIYYLSSPNASALQWLEPTKTFGKRHPFLFTQSQAILARTWVPCQDTPFVRFTYSAKVKVLPGLLALMSAENPKEKSENGEYYFRMDQPIPSYLLALAVGDIEYQPIGEKTGVYAEIPMLESVAKEFSEVQKMMEVAESIYGAYLWDRFDVLVLPPSFPFGGMENPRLTFATPTIIAGDQSLVHVVAHELAHSWSGNLVTNSTWNDFWLNEGFTVYFERRIMEALKGVSYAKMLAELGYQELKYTMKEFGEHHEDTALMMDLENRNPDDGMTLIPYEKGYFLLLALEKAIGREQWDRFLNDYFKEYAFKSIDTVEFLAYFNQYFAGRLHSITAQVAPQKWIYEPGLPSSMPAINAERFRHVEKAIRNWRHGMLPQELNTQKWSSHEWLHFIRKLPSTLTAPEMKELDEAFHFSQTKNSEILFAWLLHAANNNYQDVDPILDQFLTSVGRRKFVLPIYKALSQTNEGFQRARAIYRRARPNYHYITASSLDRLLGMNGG